MTRYSLRGPFVHLVLYLAVMLGFGVQRWHAQNEWMQANLHPEMGTPVIVDGAYSPAADLLFQALMYSNVAFIAAISSLAGVGLAQKLVTPPWGWTMLYAILSSAPLVVCVRIQQSIGHGALPKNIAFSVLIALWLFAPVYLTRRLYMSASR